MDQPPALHGVARASSPLEGLLGLSIIHFARWVIIKRDSWPDLGQGKQKLKNDYMLFCSNFNGTWDQYIDAFSDGIPSGLDLLWFSSMKYPHSIPITPFKGYIRANQIDTDYYYNSVAGRRATRRQIGVVRPPRHSGVSPSSMRHCRPADFRKLYVAALVELQIRPRLPGLCPGREQRHPGRRQTPQGLRRPISTAAAALL